MSRPKTLADNKLGTLGCVSCIHLSEGGWEHRTPSPHVLPDIELLWNILDLTLEEWAAVVKPFQEEVDRQPNNNSKIVTAGLCFVDLQPRFLKALFSYIMFFTTLERAYEVIYRDLKGINRVACFRLKHPKVPKRGPYLEKVKRIRDWSIAHLQSGKTTDVNSLAGTMWQPMSLGWKSGDTPNLERMIFRPGHVVLRDRAGGTAETSSDLEVKGLSELDHHCRAYLRGLDNTCYELLKGIQAVCPKTTSDIEYRVFG